VAQDTSAAAARRMIHLRLDGADQGGHRTGREGHGIAGLGAAGKGMEPFPAAGQGFKHGILLLKCILIAPVREAIGDASRLNGAGHSQFLTPGWGGREGQQASWWSGHGSTATEPRRTTASRREQSRLIQPRQVGNPWRPRLRQRASALTCRP